MKKIFAFVLALSMLCAMTACDKNEGSASTQESSTSSESSTGSTEDSSSTPSAPDSSSEITPTGKFDWDAAMSDFYINGIKMEYPFSESSLGEDFTFDVDNAFYNYIGDYLNIVVNHKDCIGWIFQVKYKGIDKDTYTPDCVVSSIYSMNNPSIQGINQGDSMDDVYALWGEPDKIEGKIGESQYDTAVYYGNVEGQKIYLWYNNTTNELLLITVDYIDMKGLG
ncbi:MAG: hypothetical protein J1F09_08155 [Oscillospiraceae bacterium]|nr:hypothetical protein [Oscillospiraceae bacterium]